MKYEFVYKEQCNYLLIFISLVRVARRRKREGRRGYGITQNQNNGSTFIFNWHVLFSMFRIGMFIESYISSPILIKYMNDVNHNGYNSPASKCG